MASITTVTAAYPHLICEFTIHNIFEEPEKVAVHSLLKRFGEERKYRYAKNQHYFSEQKLTSVRTQCQCNSYKIQCALTSLDEDSGKLKAFAFAKSDSECYCEIRISQVCGEERKKLKEQLRYQEVFTVDENLTKEVILNQRLRQVIMLIIKDII